MYDSILRFSGGEGGRNIVSNNMTVNQNLTKFASAGRWMWQNACRLSGPVSGHCSLSEYKSMELTLHVVFTRQGGKTGQTEVLIIATFTFTCSLQCSPVNSDYRVPEECIAMQWGIYI